MVNDKIQPFTVKKVIEALGTEDDDLVEAVIDKLRQHATADEMVEELEPVLEDETVEFVIKVSLCVQKSTKYMLIFVYQIWRFVIFEVLAHIQNLRTTVA